MKFVSSTILFEIYRSCRESKNLLNKLVEIDLGSRRGLILEQGFNAAYDLVGAMHLVDDVLKPAAGFIEIGRFMLQPVQTGAAEGGDCTQRLSDFVSDRGGELASGDNAIHMGELSP